MFLIMKGETKRLSGYNLTMRDGQNELWGTLLNGKSFIIAKGDKADEIKKALDWSIANNISSFTLE